MQEKRLIVAAIAMIGVFSVLTARLVWLSTDQSARYAVQKRSETRLTLSEGRGNIYDCNRWKLTDWEYRTYGLFSPGKESYRTWFESVDATQKSDFYGSIQRAKPFLVQLQTEQKQPEFVFRQTQRYWSQPIAAHLIGYLDGEGSGVYGLEKACNDWLEQAGTKEEVVCTVDALGSYLNTGHDIPVLEETAGTGEALMLTLDARIQRLCEGIAQEQIDRGAIVVMETATGKIRASVSMPLFDPTNVAASIEKNDTSLINRPISGYSVGSVFKPIIAAQALKAGISADMTYECTGEYELNGHIYRCAYGKGHGVVNMTEAMEQSCNCYFIQLGLMLGAQQVHEAAQAAGCGQATPIVPGWNTTAGNLPTVDELQDQGQLASVSFGQGALLASPVQVAGFLNIFANDGTYIQPTYAQGIMDEESGEMLESYYRPIQRTVFDEAIAQRVQEMMISVVENGIGAAAEPRLTTAGGKTGTAQTGRYNEDDEELLDAWFGGFYPAEEPRYTIVVMMDSGTHGSSDAARVFADIADALYCFEGCPSEDAVPPTALEEESEEQEGEGQEIVAVLAEETQPQEIPTQEDGTEQIG